MILCIGDSLTYGSIGYSYIHYLNSELKVINKGINGDTTIGAYERLQKYLSGEKYKNIEQYIVFIGTNDILLPYLSMLSPFWKLQMKPRVVMKKCIMDDNAFEKVYENYLLLLQTKHKSAILIGLPFIQLQSFPNNRIQDRNEIIKKLAEKYHMPFIDVYSLQSAVLLKPIKYYSWGSTSILRIIEAIIMSILPFTKDWFSHTRHLELTVDGVHFNSLSAKLLAKAIGYNICQRADE